MPRPYKTYRSSGYGYECRSELTEVPGTGKYPGYGSGRTLHNTTFSSTEVPGKGMEILKELTDVPDTGMEVLHNSLEYTNVVPAPVPTPGYF